MRKVWLPAESVRRIGINAAAEIGISKSVHSKTLQHNQGTFNSIQELLKLPKTNATGKRRIPHVNDEFTLEDVFDCQMEMMDWPAEFKRWSEQYQSPARKKGSIKKQQMAPPFLAGILGTLEKVATDKKAEGKDKGNDDEREASKTPSCYKIKGT